MPSRRKTVKRFHEPGDLHEITFSCYRRMPLLSNEEWRHALAESLDTAILAQKCRLVAYVFMPEHVHLLVQPMDHAFRIDLLLKAIKAPFSSRIKKQLESINSPLLERLTVRERQGVFCFRFWQEGGGYDRNLRTRKAIEASIAYIHENPVPGRLCEPASEWRWSSVRHYQAEGAAHSLAERPPGDPRPELGIRPMIFRIHPTTLVEYDQWHPILTSTSILTCAYNLKGFFCFFCPSMNARDKKFDRDPARIPRGHL